ncbi:hypothetical protein HID58_065310, partial [Brassica napus]
HKPLIKREFLFCGGMGDGTGLEHASCIPTLCFLHTTKSITDRTLWHHLCLSNMRPAYERRESLHHLCSLLCFLHVLIFSRAE